MVGGDLSFASGGYAQTALKRRPAGRARGHPAQRAIAPITKDAFKPKLTPAGRSHPVTSLSLDPEANEARWAALPPLEGINRVARLQARRLRAAGPPHPAHRGRRAGARCWR